ncbi:MAG: DNA alkylation repair protein [Bacteroidales bacterium]|nr:DNA alkylation repair protein [Bacteroidales bacterium]
MMALEDKIREIRIQLRSAMNGVVSHSMRQKGLTYGLNFGVDLPTLRTMANRWDKDHELAQALWKENVREFKILSGLLQPIESFTPELADEWARTILNKEIAEMTAMHLFQYLSYGLSISFRWMASLDEMIQICGFLTFSRILNKEAELDERLSNEFISQSLSAMKDDSYALSSASFLALRKFISKSAQHRAYLKPLLTSFKQSDNEKEQKIYFMIQEELSYL